MSEIAEFFLPTYTPAVVPTGIGLVYQPDHAGEADSRLLVQFKDSVNLHALVKALVKPFQALEQAAFQVLDAFDVDTAIGKQLDMVGGLAGEDREARSDVAYRAYIKARILANASDGAPGTIYALARMLLGDDPTVTYEPDFPAGYALYVSGTTLQFPWDMGATESPDVVARALADAMLLATSAGVSFILFYQFTDDAHAFTFASADAEENDVDRGFADDDELDPGGVMIGVEERR